MYNVTEQSQALAKMPLGGPERANLDWNTLRAGHVALKATRGKIGPASGFKSEDTTVTARDGYEIPIRIYWPEKPREGGAPLTVWYHGGGFVVGDLDGEDLTCRICAAELGCVAITVDYRLAPEHPFPTGVNDSWDVMKWVGNSSVMMTC
jgi:acetyl esterase/lipase